MVALQHYAHIYAQSSEIPFEKSQPFTLVQVHRAMLIEHPLYFGIIREQIMELIFGKKLRDASSLIRGV